LAICVVDVTVRLESDVAGVIFGECAGEST
jgi:hypothetical protein